MLKICWMIYKVSSGSGEIPFMTKDSEGSEQGQPSLMTKLVPTRSHTHTHTHVHRYVCYIDTHVHTIRDQSCLCGLM